MSRQTTTEIEFISDQIAAMRQQEENGSYKYSDYFSTVTSTTCQNSQSKPADAQCRFKMAVWCKQVAEYLNLSLETVEIAMRYMDRYLSTPKGAEALLDRKEFQLSAMTALHIATKLFEPVDLDTRCLSILSKGAYSVERMVKMERDILDSLQWRMNPPTVASFVRMFAEKLSLPMTEQHDDTLFFWEICQMQMEFAIGDYSLVKHRASTVAAAIILNAIECCVHSGNVGIRRLLLSNNTARKDLIKNELMRLANIDVHGQEIADAKSKLRTALPEAMQFEHTVSSSPEYNDWKNTGRSLSPVSVRNNQ